METCSELNQYVGETTTVNRVDSLRVCRGPTWHTSTTQARVGSFLTPLSSHEDFECGFCSPPSLRNCRRTAASDKTCSKSSQPKENTLHQSGRTSQNPSVSGLLTLLETVGDQILTTPEEKPKPVPRRSAKADDQCSRNVQH